MRAARLAGLVASITGLCIAVPAWAAIPSYAEFGQWLLACDDVGRCEARGAREGGVADLRIIRDSRNAPRELRIRAGVALDQVPGDSVLAGRLSWDTVRLDGAALTLDRRAWRLERQGTLATLISRDPASTAAFIGRVAGAHVLNTGADDGDVLLDGMAEVLRRMNDTQSRTRSGPARAEAPKWHPVPRLPDERAHALARRMRQSQYRALAASRCEHLRGYRLQDEADALDRSHVLVLLDCAGGAYQGSSLGFITGPDGGAVTRVRLPLPTMDKMLAVFTTAIFASKDGTFTTTFNGSGYGVCGYGATWVWSGGAFRLTLFRRKDACGGPIEAEWPVLVGAGR